MTVIRSFFLALAFVLALAAPPAGGARAAEGFVEGFDDLPLLPGLSPLKEEGLSFDKPAGRIVQAAARGAVSTDAVRKFYRETAPQLGWRLGDGEGRFVRDGETLRVEVRPDAAGQVIVRFSLSPE